MRRALKPLLLALVMAHPLLAQQLPAAQIPTLGEIGLAALALALAGGGAAVLRRRR